MGLGEGWGFLGVGFPESGEGEVFLRVGKGEISWGWGVGGVS